MTVLMWNHQTRGAAGSPGKHRHVGASPQPPRAAESGQRSHTHPPPEGVHPLGPGKESGGFDSSSFDSALTVSPGGEVK